MSHKLQELKVLEVLRAFWNLTKSTGQSVSEGFLIDSIPLPAVPGLILHFSESHPLILNS